MTELEQIDYRAPAMGPVREHVTARIVELTAKVINPRTPLEDVPMHRGEIAALSWLLDQLAPPKETIL